MKKYTKRLLRKAILISLGISFFLPIMVSLVSSLYNQRLPLSDPTEWVLFWIIYLVTLPVYIFGLYLGIPAFEKNKESGE